MKTTPAPGALGIVLDPSIDPLILDFLDWLAPEPRPYAEVMEAWRTSCPRLPVWEDAVERGLVVRRHDQQAGRPIVTLTATGHRMREARGQRA